MFFGRSASSDTETPSADTLTARAMTASTAAAQNARLATQNARLAAQNAAAGANRGVQQGMYGARGWVAPRMDSAADYWTLTLAPKVSAALKAGARQVSPEPVVTQSSKRSSAFTWTMLGAAVLAALGAVGALVRYRFQTAIAAETEEGPDTMTTSGTGQANLGADRQATVPGQAGPDASNADTTVNGRVSSNGW